MEREVTLRFDLRRRTVSSQLAAAEDVGGLLQAYDSGALSRETATDLVLGGHSEVLIGQNEGDWLEAKTTHYDVATLVGQAELAPAAARFTNSSSGRLVVVGMRTRNAPAGEVVAKITPVPAGVDVARRFRAISRIGCTRRLSDCGCTPCLHARGQLMVIDVPPQPAELKPFLVHGAAMGGKGYGAFISIVTTIGDHGVLQRPL